jgi:hypothetical protein
MLRSHARYWRRDAKGQAKRLLTQDEMDHKGIKMPSHGIVELCAQSGVLCWPEMLGDFVSTPCQSLLFSPCFVQRANASCLFSAVEQAELLLSLEKLFEMTLETEFVLFFLGSDLASSCSRAKQEAAARIRQHNDKAERCGHGVVIIIDGPCVAHVLQREIEHAFQTKARQ